MKLPGLIDPHVHIREPGAIHKEDWDSGTAAALAGGFTMVLAMPNTQPPITDRDSLHLALGYAKGKARCDYAQFLGAGPDNSERLSVLAGASAGLKMYLDQTYGPLRLDNMLLWMEHFERWPKSSPIVAHAEGRTMAAVILIATLFDRPLHLAHVSTREEIRLIRAAKLKGFRITCEVTPHHLFLTEVDQPALGARRSEVRPPLAKQSDRDALWEHLEVIDCFASDHAPHTLQEKDSSSPPPGYPGLETSLALLLTAVSEGRLSMEDLVTRMHVNPSRIFNLPEQPDTWIDVDLDFVWEIRADQTYTRCAWTPFEGWRVRGRTRSATLRGELAYQGGKILAQPGYGRDIRSREP